MGERFLPFRQAPRQNRQAVYKPETVYDGAKDLAVSRDLERKQACARALGRLPLNHEVPSVSNWRELMKATLTWTLGHITNRDLSAYADYLPTDRGYLAKSTPEEATEHVLKVAAEGIVTCGAFLEVIPKVLMTKEFSGQDPNEAIAQYAWRSQALMLEWAAVHPHVDTSLAYAISRSPKPEPSQIYENLVFDPRWFAELDGRVVIDPSRASNLRDDTIRDSVAKRVKHPSKLDDGKMPLFSCPGQHWIPLIYGQMTESAKQSNLFGSTYQQERNSHGYLTNEQYAELLLSSKQ